MRREGTQFPPLFPVEPISALHDHQRNHSSSYSSEVARHTHGLFGHRRLPFGRHPGAELKIQLQLQLQLKLRLGGDRGSSLDSCANDFIDAVDFACRPISPRREAHLADGEQNSRARCLWNHGIGRERL